VSTFNGNRPRSQLCRGPQRDWGSADVCRPPWRGAGADRAGGCVSIPIIRRTCSTSWRRRISAWKTMRPPLSSSLNASPAPPARTRAACCWIVLRVKARARDAGGVRCLCTVHLCTGRQSQTAARGLARALASMSSGAGSPEFPRRRSSRVSRRSAWSGWKRTRRGRSAHFQHQRGRAWRDRDRAIGPPLMPVSRIDPLRIPSPKRIGRSTTTPLYDCAGG
jgi:hypothetical protein